MSSAGTGIRDDAASAMHLVDYRAGDLKQVPTRNGFGEGLIEAGTRNRDVLGICADLAESTVWEVEGRDTVTAAPELVRLTLNLQRTGP